MTIPYFARMACLCLAAFFLAHLALAAAAAALSPFVLRRASRMRPDAGARLLFAWRIAPAAAAGSIVAGLCAPAYLVFEPIAASERIAATCLAAAAAGAWVCAAGLLRGVRAAARSRQVAHSARQSGRPLLALAGVFRPRLVVSPAVREALTADQLAVAVRHERAHGESRDNLKRLLILMTPDVLPFVRGPGAVERAWKRLAEWAADDRAVRGNRRRALSLAAALVAVARLGAAPWAPLATHLLGDPADLAARVQRLLDRPSGGPVPSPVWPGALALSCLAAAALQAPLPRVHELLEALAH
jgi:hypothetical protein